MVTHDYQCAACGNSFEHRHRITDPAPDSLRCEKCGASAERQPGTGGTRACVMPDWKAYASVRLPKWTKAAGVKHDELGHAILPDRSTEDRVLKTLGYERD